MKGILITMLLLPAALPTWAVEPGMEPGNENGNGGDEIRMLFTEARSHAARKILGIKRCALKPEVPEAVADWLLLNRAALASDVLDSPHRWITGTQSTCAFTQTNSRAPITLSFVMCRPEQTIGQAARVLTHESVHHLGEPSEEFADQVALAVDGAEEVASCPDPTVDPFEPSSCMGAPLLREQILGYFEPAQAVSRPFGTSLVATRKRLCGRQTGCLPWGAASLTLEANRFNGLTETVTYPERFDGGPLQFTIGSTGNYFLKLESPIEPKGNFPYLNGRQNLVDPKGFISSCQVVPGGRSTQINCMHPGFAATVVNTAGDGTIIDRQPFFPFLSWPGSPRVVWQSRTLTDQCLRLTATTSTLLSGDGQRYEETEIGYLARF